MQAKPKKIVFKTIESKGIKDNFQMDIMYLPNPSRNKYKYLLTCLDVYSRYAFAEPILKKDKEDTLKGFLKIIHKSGKPKNLNVDSGKEFNNDIFKSYCDKNDIKIWFSNPEQDNKNAIVERFHRTLRNKLLRYEVIFKKPYIDDLQKIINSYNNSYHTTIKTEPKKIWDGDAKNNQTITIPIYDFKIGDRVRHVTDISTFEKRFSTEKYSKEIYTIEKIEGNSYFLNGLSKPYKGYQLVKAVEENNNDSTYFQNIKEDKKKDKINKILKKDGIDSNNILSGKRRR